jgi:hypothetical protein
VLLFGGEWPVPCFPQPVPGPCAVRNALCYANRTRSGYDFVSVRPQAGYTYEPHRTWTWNSATAPGVERVLDRVRRRDLRWIRQSAPGAIVRAAYEVSWTYGLQSDEALIVFVAEPRQGASLTLSLQGTMSGSLLDPKTGKEILPVRVETAPRDLVEVELPAGRAVVLALGRER